MRNQTTIPPWVVKTIVTTVIGLLLGGFAAWGRTISTRSHDHETRISVTEEKVSDMRSDINEIKHSQERIEDKLDRALRRR